MSCRTDNNVQRCLVQYCHLGDLPGGHIVEVYCDQFGKTWRLGGGGGGGGRGSSQAMLCCVLSGQHCCWSCLPVLHHSSPAPGTGYDLYPLALVGLLRTRYCRPTFLSHSIIITTMHLVNFTRAAIISGCMSQSFELFLWTPKFHVDNASPK